MSREGGKILLTSKENHVCGCFVLETTDLRESVENDRISPRTQDGHRSINGNVHLQFQSFSEAVSKSILLRDALRVFIYEKSLVCMASLGRHSTRRRQYSTVS